MLKYFLLQFIQRTLHMQFKITQLSILQTFTQLYFIVSISLKVRNLYC